MDRQQRNFLRAQLEAMHLFEASGSIEGLEDRRQWLAGAPMPQAVRRIALSMLLLEDNAEAAMADPLREVMQARPARRA